MTCTCKQQQTLTELIDRRVEAEREFRKRKAAVERDYRLLQKDEERMAEAGISLRQARAELDAFIAEQAGE